jgi:monothiol glutaredoxin
METLTRVHPSAAAARAAFHADVVSEVARTVAAQPVVVVGMSTNPFVKRARDLLTEQGIAFTYLEYGGYLSQWKQRLAVKMWSGWPTFPQVFVGGALVGGFKDLKALRDSGELATLVAEARSN